MRRLLIGILVGCVLAAAGGVWAYGHQRYGRLLQEFRWRHELRGTRSVERSTPASPLLSPRSRTHTLTQGG